jgi:hypothetical protein
MRGSWLLVACVPLLSGAAVAADSFKDVQYVSGKAGFGKKVWGVLTVDEKAVSFSDERGKALFSIPIAEIDKSAAGTQQEEGSFGRKMALGIFASHTDEYLHRDAQRERSRGRGLQGQEEDGRGDGGQDQLLGRKGSEFGGRPAAGRACAEARGAASEPLGQPPLA